MNYFMNPLQGMTTVGGQLWFAAMTLDAHDVPGEPGEVSNDSTVVALSFGSP